MPNLGTELHDLGRLKFVAQFMSITVSVILNNYWTLILFYRHVIAYFETYAQAELPRAATSDNFLQ